MRLKQGFIFIFLLGYILIGCSLIVIYNSSIKLNEQISAVKERIGDIEQQNLTLYRNIISLSEKIQKLNQPQSIHENDPIVPKEPDEPDKVSRGAERRKPVTMRVTAYDLSYASCKKKPDHPEYGITASGNRVQEWYTIAAGPEIPFGTKIFIPFFQDKPNQGIFVVHDRGSAIKEGCLDVYMKSNKECMEFGLRELEVYVLE